MFVKIDANAYNLDQITEIYDNGVSGAQVYFAVTADGKQNWIHLEPDEYARLMHALETKNLLYVA